MSLNITSYDPVDLKASLIDFMKSTPEFADYEYRDGSALNTVLDILVRNTHYIAYQANMAATESFLDSAQIRSNIVSHAQKLSYTPKSKTATTTEVSIEVTPSDVNTEGSLKMDKGSVFLHRAGDILYSFTNTEDVILTRTPTGTFKIDSVLLKQGQLLTRTFHYNRETGSIELPYPDMDTTTLRVYVVSGTAGEMVEYQLVEDITTVSKDSSVFYLSENHVGNFQIQFGKGLLGVEPEELSQVIVEFVNTDEHNANTIKDLFAAKPIQGYSNIQVDVLVEGYGGAPRQTLDTIKFLAPKIYSAQNRAVRPSDYQAILLREFPFIRAARVWGGEDNDPPYYGRVMISAIPQEGYEIADSVKTSIEHELSKYSVVGIKPMLVDSGYIGVDLRIRYMYDNTKISATEDQMKAYITDAVKKYNDNKLGLFDYWYNNSELIREIYTVPAITSIEIDKVLFIEQEVTEYVNKKYTFGFNNHLVPKSLRVRSNPVLDLVATSTKIYDDGNGVVWVEMTKYDVTNRLKTGTIDYTTGRVELDLLILSNDTPWLTVEVQGVDDNVYVDNNQIVEIDKITVLSFENR